MSMQPTGGAPAPSPVLVSIGSVGVTQDRIVTPSGTWPAAQVNITAQDQSSSTSHIPTWAIVMTVVTVWFFLLGLLFLLAKERRTQGNVSVSIWAANGQSHTEFVQVFSEEQRVDVFNRVSYAQNIIGQARWRESAAGN